MNNLRSAIRQLVKYPGLTLLAVLTLAMGTGAITAIFSVVKAVLLQPLPFEKPNDLVVVWANNPHQGLQGFGTSYPNFLDWKLQNHSFVDLAASSPDSFNVTIGTEPERVRGASVSANFFSVFGVNPILGRSFLPGEDSLGRDNVVLLGQPFWEQHFGGNSNIIGQTMTLNSKVVTIVGVMPRQFHFPFSSEVWVPVTLDNKSKESRGYWWLNVVGRLKSGSGIANAQADMDTVSRRLAQQYPETHSGWGAKLVGIHEQTVGSARDEILLLFMAGVFVLLIACANVANLQLIRTSERHQEFGIRTAIGATRNDIVVQILTENAFLFALGGLCGFLIAAFSIEYFLKFVPSNIPRIRDVHVDFPLFLFTLLISLANGFIFGLLPALKRPAMDLYSVLKGAGKGGIGDGSSSRVRQFLIVSEVSLALMLLVAGAFLLKSFLQLQRVNPGFDSARVLAARIALPQSKYGNEALLRTFYASLLEKIEVLPDVQSVSLATTFPLTGGALYNSFLIEGESNQDFSKAPSVLYNPITADYFSTLKIPLLQGRFFTQGDRADSPPVAIVNKSLARRHFGNEGPLHRQIRIEDGKEKLWCEIVGVVDDVKQYGLNQLSSPEIYLPYTQRCRRWMTLLVRTRHDPMLVYSSVRHSMTEIDKDQPLHGVSSLDAVMFDSVGEARFRSVLLGMLALFALSLASIGIYGVIAYSVSRRTREIGVRTALGAQRKDILLLILKQGFGVVSIGMLLGCLGSLLVGRSMAGLLFGVRPFDVYSLGAVVILFAIVAFIACLIPARRALTMDPMNALRYE